MKRSDVAVLVLAAGAGSRFVEARPAAPWTGSDAPDTAPPTKLLALIDGRPIIEHVLARALAFGPAATIVVLGQGPGADALEERICWRDELRVHNPHPDRGLAWSVRTGLEALASSESLSVKAALIMLGDQPRVSLEVMRQLLEAATATPGIPIIAPRYAAGGGGNPLLIRREAWSLAAELDGDRGFGPLLAARPDLVRHLDVPGSNPDVDTPADLASLSRA